MIPIKIARRMGTAQRSLPEFRAAHRAAHFGFAAGLIRERLYCGPNHEGGRMDREKPREAFSRGSALHMAAEEGRDGLGQLVFRVAGGCRGDRG